MPKAYDPHASKSVESVDAEIVSPFGVPIHVGRPNIGDRARFFALMNEIFDRHWLTNDGPLVRRFETAVAEHLGVAHCVALCNGTIALEVAIRALGLAGEVIVPSFTFIAGPHALRWLGLTPVFADIDPVTHNLDPESVRRAITSRTTGILGVHLWGRPAPIGELQLIARQYKLKLFFDAAHAFSCCHSGRMIGGFGDCEVFSFHATKFFNTFEGGAITTNSHQLAEKMRRLRNFGFSGLDNVVDDGTNGKMIEAAAAMGLVNLDEIDRIIGINRANYHAYREHLSSTAGLKLLPYNEAERCNFQYVVLELGPEFGVCRDTLVSALRAKNILARRYFWPGCHRMRPYHNLGPTGDQRLPITERIAERVVVLPTGSSVNAQAIDFICAMIKSVAAQKNSTNA